MTEGNIVTDGQLQVENLKAVLDSDELGASMPCIVMVVDEDATLSRLMVEGIEGERNIHRCIMPMLGCALGELAKRAMCSEPEALSVVGRFFGLSREKNVTVATLEALKNALSGGEEMEGEDA